jgi:hypothetical protein
LSCLIIGDKCWEGNRGGSGPFSLPTTGPHVVPREADPDLRGSQVRPRFSNRYWVFLTPSVDRYRPTSARCNRNSTAGPDLTIRAGPPLHLCRTRTLPGTHLGDDPSAATQAVQSGVRTRPRSRKPRQPAAMLTAAWHCPRATGPAQPSRPALRPTPGAKSWVVPSWGSGTGPQLLLAQLARLRQCHLRPALRDTDTTRAVAAFLLTQGASEPNTW